MKLDFRALSAQAIAAAAAAVLAAPSAMSEEPPAPPQQTVEHALSQISAAPDGAWQEASRANFTGRAWSKAAYRQTAPARGYGAFVHFEAGARTHWHIHPLGQTLVVLSGTGLTQALLPDGSLGSVSVIRPGDVVRCPPNIMHWHGAAPDSAMMHLAISERDPERPVEWKAPVADEAYLAGAESALRKAAAED